MGHGAKRGMELHRPGEKQRVFPEMVGGGGGGYCAETGWGPLSRQGAETPPPLSPSLFTA